MIQKRTDGTARVWDRFGYLWIRQNGSWRRTQVNIHDLNEIGSRCLWRKTIDRIFRIA